MGYIATFSSLILLLLMLVPGTPISLQGVEYTLFIIWLVIGIVIYILYNKQEIKIDTISNRKGEMSNE